MLLVGEQLRRMMTLVGEKVQGTVLLQPGDDGKRYGWGYVWAWGGLEGLVVDVRLGLRDDGTGWGKPHRVM